METDHFQFGEELEDFGFRATAHHAHLAGLTQMLNAMKDLCDIGGTHSTRHHVSILTNMDTYGMFL